MAHMEITMIALFNQIPTAFGVVVTSAVFAVSASALAETQIIEKSYSVESGEQLVIKSDTGSVDIKTWNKNEVGIWIQKESRKSDSLDEYLISLEKSNGEVTIMGEAPRSNRVSVRYRIQVPASFDVEVDTGGGFITVDDINGTVNVDTSGGSISIGNVSGGDVKADTSGGSIEIGNATGTVYANTSGGNIEVGNVEGDLTVDTSGGSIRIGDVQGESKIETSGGSIKVAHGGTETEANTSGGNIEIGPSSGDVIVDTSGGNIRVANASGNVKADTSGGSVKVEGSTGWVEVDSSGGSLFVGSSGSYVKADTSGGNITIEQARGFIEADTSGGHIEAELLKVEPGVDAHVKLSSSGGDLRLTIPRSMAATVDAQIKITRRATRDYSVYSEPPLKLTGEDTDKVRASGEINGGGDKLVFRTTNGDIFIEFSDD
jgi:hypothetical protein